MTEKGILTDIVRTLERMNSDIKKLKSVNSSIDNKIARLEQKIRRQRNQ